MTDDVKWIIDQKDENGLRGTISLLMESKHKNKAELIAYCEKKLDGLNRSEAEVEFGEIRMGEV